MRDNTQKRAQAENLTFGDHGDNVGLPPQAGSKPGNAIGQHHSERVVVSGWQIYDNKGRVIEKYEPFFDDGWEFQPEWDAKQGEHVEMYYDPRGQMIRTVNPDGSEQRVILGVPGKIGATDLKNLDDYEPTPWEKYTYDANDLAEISLDPIEKLPGGSPQSLSDYAPQAHHYTPTSVLFNAQGKVICQVERNGDLAQDWFITRSRYDVRGNLLSVWDAKGREAFKYAYDLLNCPLRVDSIDAGLRTSVIDAQGNLIEFRDSKGAVVLHEYDALNRPLCVWARNNAAAASVTLRERIEYGDQRTDRDAMRGLNALGKPVEHWDEAGILSFNSYDFKGNLLEKARQVISDATLSQLAVGQQWVADWSKSDMVNALDPSIYQTQMSYDALNRPVEISYPADVYGQHALLQPIYNRAGELESVKLNNDTYVDHIAFIPCQF